MVPSHDDGAKPRPGGGYEVLDHTGDIGLRVWSATESGIFEMAAQGLFALICDISRIESLRSTSLSLTAPSRAELLVRWLNELNLICQLDGVVLGEFSVNSLKNNKISAVVSGEAIAKKHRIVREVKAVTYHDVQFAGAASAWTAQVILDL